VTAGGSILHLTGYDMCSVHVFVFLSRYYMGNTI
jgi:hypothetical protein